MKENPPFISEAVIAKRIVYNEDMLGLLNERRAMLLAEVERIEKQIVAVKVDTIALKREMRMRRA